MCGGVGCCCGVCCCGVGGCCDTCALDMLCLHARCNSDCLSSSCFSCNLSLLVFFFTSVHFTFLRSSLILTATATSTATVTAMRLRCELDATSANQRLCSTLARGSVIYRIECRDDWAGPARILMPICLCV